VVVDVIDATILGGGGGGLLVGSWDK